MIHFKDLAFKPCAIGGEGQTTQSWALASECDEGRVQHGVWETGPGTLDLRFEWTETAFILEGEAVVRNRVTDETATLIAGSFMSFERGSHWTWQIPQKLKKVFTLIE